MLFLVKRAVHKVKAFSGEPQEIKAGENTGPECPGCALGLVPSLQHTNTLSSCLQPSNSSPHPTLSPDWHLVPGVCGPSSLAHLTGSRQEETLAWPGCPPSSPLPCSSLHLLGEGRTQRRIFPLAPSSSLWPSSLSLPGLAEAKENRASPAHSHSLSLTSCSGKMVYSLPRPGSGPGLGVKFLQSFQNQRPCLGSSWTPHLSPFHLFWFLPSQPRALCPSLPIVKFCSSGGRKIQWKEGFLGDGGMEDESRVAEDRAAGEKELSGTGEKVLWTQGPNRLPLRLVDLVEKSSCCPV